MAMTNEKKQEYTRKITQANGTGLVVILYDMTLTFLEDAEKAGQHKVVDQCRPYSQFQIFHCSTPVMYIV